MTHFRLSDALRPAKSVVVLLLRTWESNADNYAVEDWFAKDQTFFFLLKNPGVWFIEFAVTVGPIGLSNDICIRFIMPR